MSTRATFRRSKFGSHEVTDDIMLHLVTPLCPRLRFTQGVTRWRSCASNRGLQFLEWAGRLIPQGPVVSGVKQTWKTAWLALMRELAPQSDSGAFVRASYAFHRDIGSDPSLPIEKGRYHVYVGNACPWCHRILLTIVLLGLEDLISIGKLQDDPEKASRGGWIFEPGPDPVTGCTDLRGVYDRCVNKSEGFHGRCTAPLLIDKKTMRIVSNESSLMMRNFNEIDWSNGTGIDLRPVEQLDQIEELNTHIYENVNNGVYKCGFATSQSAYDAASDALFSEFHRLNSRLSTSRFLLGDKITECDVRLFPTVMRFDPIYSTIFHCSRYPLDAFPHLSRWLRDFFTLYVPSSSLQIHETLDVADARRSYCELFPLNPSGIIYDGPSLEVDHDRGNVERTDLNVVSHKRRVSAAR